MEQYGAQRGRTSKGSFNWGRWPCFLSLRVVCVISNQGGCRVRAPETMAASPYFLKGELVTRRFGRWKVASRSLSVRVYPTSQLPKLFSKAVSPVGTLVCRLAFFISCEASLSNWSLFVFWNYCAPDRLCFVAHRRGSYDQITAVSLCVFFTRYL